jgi:hypothetical protein
VIIAIIGKFICKIKEKAQDNNNKKKTKKTLTHKNNKQKNHSNDFKCNLKNKSNSNDLKPIITILLILIYSFDNVSILIEFIYCDVYPSTMLYDDS